MGIEGTRIAIRTVPLDDAVPAAEDGDGLQVVTTHDHFGDAVTAASHALRTAFQPARVRVHPLTGAEQSCEDEAMVVLASSVGRSGPLMLVFDPSVPAGVVIAPLATPGAPTEGALARDHRRLRVRLEQIS
jgi:hypothetical protein